MTRESGEKGSTDAPGLAAPLPGDWVEALRKVLVPLDAQGCKVAFAESCTAGLAASAVSGIEGLGHVLDCAFVTYSDNAKTRLLNVDPAVIADIGAVSQPVARAMAEGVLERSAADVAISVTGFAGPAGPQDEEGLVHFALGRTRLPTRCRVEHFGALGVNRVRLAALGVVIELLGEATQRC